jgi:hypothetical protein
MLPDVKITGTTQISQIKQQKEICVIVRLSRSRFAVTLQRNRRSLYNPCLTFIVCGVVDMSPVPILNLLNIP